MKNLLQDSLRNIVRLHKKFITDNSITIPHGLTSDDVTMEDVEKIIVKSRGETS